MAKLEGITKISSYMNRSDITILKLIQTAGFPAKRTKDFVWTASTEDIEKWRKKQDEPVRRQQTVVTKSKRGTVKSSKK
jgi:hypothetical protein